MSEKLHLPNVTILCMGGVNSDVGIKALVYSIKDIQFAKAVILSHKRPKIVPDYINFIEIPELTHHTYSYFCLQNLHTFFNTDFVLLIQDDGFVINSHLWTDEFLKYDYIGAPWRAHYPHARVGNGGFSLRSKKLVNLCRTLTWNGEHEDGAICIFNRHIFEQNGCRFAPLDLAMKFSLESKIPECKNYSLDTCFGFHGRGEVTDVFEDGGQQFKDKLKLLNSVVL